MSWRKRANRAIGACYTCFVYLHTSFASEKGNKRRTPTIPNGKTLMQRRYTISFHWLGWSGKGWSALRGENGIGHTYFQRTDSP